MNITRFLQFHEFCKAFSYHLTVQSADREVADEYWANYIQNKAHRPTSDVSSFPLTAQNESLRL